MSVTCTRKSPFSRALPRMLSSSGAAIMRGNRVRTSTDSTSFLLDLEQTVRHVDDDAPGRRQHFLHQPERHQRAAPHLEQLLRSCLLEILDDAVHFPLPVAHLDSEQVY